MAKTPSASDYRKLIKQGIKSPVPAGIAPMLCTLTKEPLDDPEYLYELKWDGYRIISYVGKHSVRQ